MKGEKLADNAYSSFNYDGGAAYGNEKEASQAAHPNGLSDEFQRQTPAPEGRDWFCRMCNNVNEARAGVCTVCGSPHRGNNGVEKQSTAEQDDEVRKWVKEDGKTKEGLWAACCCAMCLPW
eukprot:jgi/Chlat1/4375/Chrsp29S04611